MRIETPPEAINREALLFGVAAGVIATTALSLIVGMNFLLAALIGILLALVVWFILTWLGKELPPPAGEGHVEATEESTPASKPTMPEAVAPSPQVQSTAPVEEAPVATAITPDPEPSTVAGEQPEALTAARDGGADDLKQIKGVGPKLEALLNSMGIYHLDQIAAWTPDHVAWMDEHLEGFKGRVSRDDWVGQAQSLASS